MGTYPQETAARDAGTVQDLSERLVMRSHCNTYTLSSGQSIPDLQWFSAVPLIKVFTTMPYLVKSVFSHLLQVQMVPMVFLKTQGLLDGVQLH